MLCLHYVNQKGLHPRITMANFPGIYTAKRKDGSTYFRASATHLKKHISLGSYETEEDVLFWSIPPLRVNNTGFFQVFPMINSYA